MLDIVVSGGTAVLPSGPQQADIGVAAARAKGVPIYGETLHQYLMYTAEDYKKPDGQIYHTYPSLKFREDQEALWRATDHGAIQTVATDEICCPLRIKLQGRRIDDTTGGNAGVEPRLSLIYTETVEKRSYGLSDFVGLVSANAAKIMSLYPRKGRWRSVPTQTSCSSTRVVAKPCAPPNRTKPITAPGRAAISPPGRQ